MKSEVISLAVELSGEVERLNNEFEKYLVRSGKAAREKTVEAAAAAVTYCASHFYTGVSMSGSTEVALWATEWNQCSLLLLNLMTSAPSILVENDLMRVCLEMTQGKELLLDTVLYYIENKKIDLVAGIFEAGYSPLINTQGLYSICHTKDVTRCPRPYFEKIALPALQSMTRDPMLHHPAPELAAIAGRYISCLAPDSNAIEDLKRSLWPEVKRLTDYEDKDFPLFLQNAIAQYPSKRAMSLVSSIKESYRETPLLLLNLMEQKYRYFYGRDFNPFGAGDIKYDGLKPDFFNHDAYFKAIMNDSMIDDFFWGTISTVIQSKVDYSALPSYASLSELSKSSMLELVKDDLGLGTQAAVLMKLAPLENADEVLQGTEGWLARYVFQTCMRNIYDACDLPALTQGDFLNGLASLEIEEKIAVRVSLVELESLSKIKAGTTVDFDMRTLSTASSFAQCNDYLSTISSIETIEKAKEYCEAVQANNFIGNPHRDTVLTRVEWQNTSVRDAIFSTDLGL